MLGRWVMLVAIVHADGSIEGRGFGYFETEKACEFLLNTGPKDGTLWVGRCATTEEVHRVAPDIVIEETAT